MWWAPLIGLATSLIGNAVSGGGGSTTAKTPPPPPKPEFQPLERRSLNLQPMNFDPGASPGGIDPNDTRLQAIASLRGKLGL